ncbi:Asparagine synthetase domain-containing protein 1 [Nymphon striatum]|nr:Asparagine synthetase domain-containing protein 1 [Nymphon striatum]
MAAFVVSPVPMSVGGSVLDYLRYFRDIIVCNQWTDAQSAAIFKPLLGVGSHVLDDVPEADLTSFDKIDKVLSRKEAPFREASCSDLMSIYMRVGETVEEFRCRLTDLVEKCYGGFAQRNRQQLIRDFFVHRLADDLKSAILCTQSTKLDDAVNSALMAESMRGKFNFNNRAVRYKPFTQDRIRQSKTATCFYCKKAGHFKRNCPQLNVRVSRTDSIRQNKTVTCFYCKKAGHVKSNCPKLIVGVSRTATLEGDISSRFLLPVQLEHGCVQDFLVDSGGQSSCLPHAHFVSDGDYGRKLRFRSVNGTEIKVTGSKTLNLIMDGQRFTHKFPIVNMEGSPILGVDLLKKMRATICFKDGLIKLGNGSTFTLKPENIVKDCFAKASNIVDSRECDEKLDVNGETSDWFIEMAKVDNCYIAQKEDLAPEIEEESSWMVSKNIELAGKHVTEDLEALCNKYEEIFKQPKFSQSVGEHTIVTTAAPISQRPYKIPRVYEQQVTQKIDQMLNDGIIQESTSPWCNPLVNVTKEELITLREEHIKHLIFPHNTVLDDSIGCAIWFAARAEGLLLCEDGCKIPYTCPARVILVGMGADEQLAGYSRHREKFRKESWAGLLNEVKLDIGRISHRNLGRDDRIISDHGREARFPYLDEDLMEFLCSVPINFKANLNLKRGVGEKLLLRLLAYKLGLTKASSLPKRAIQFGSKIAKLEHKSENAKAVCSRLNLKSKS